MSIVHQWRLTVADKLYERMLMGWVTPMDEGSLDTIAGQEPDKTDVVAWKAWANDYLQVQGALEISLGSLRGPIINHPKYQVPRWHPIMARYYLIQSLLEDEAKSSSVCTLPYPRMTTC